MFFFLIALNESTGYEDGAANFVRTATTQLAIIFGDQAFCLKSVTQ